MKKSSIYILVFLFFTGIAGCKRSGCPADVDLAYNEVITNYHEACFKQLIERVTENHFSIYLDYSGSMKVAFADKGSEKFYNLFINSLKISNVDFYEVNNDKIDKLENLDKSELYKKIKTTEKFTGKNAPLNEAMKQITLKDGESVFITDGELWEDQERDDPWAREEFGNWLKDGNAIDFFVTDHKDAGKQKHVFYMFFIPKTKINDKENIANQFRFYLQNSTEAKDLAFTGFSFSNGTYKLIQEYKTATSGGVNENAGQDETAYVNRGLDLGFEYIDLMTKWKDLMKYIMNAYDNNGNQIPGGDPLLSKLFVETSKLEFYTIEELGIKVYNINVDFAKFKKTKEALLNKPTFVLDEKGEKMLDEQNKPILECPGQFECYNETGVLIIDSVFKHDTNLPVLNEVFDFDTQAFMNNFKNQGRGEVIVKLHKNFDGSQISAETENFLRIDIYLKKVTPKTDNPNLSKFIWQGKQVEKNTSIYNSILGALNEANPEGKTIYTYYVRTLPYKN